jgi:DNA-binding NarL/FixJ family response regulator
MQLAVVVVGDRRAFRDCVRRLLKGQGCRVVGETPDGAAGLSRATDLRSQLALVDVHLSDRYGFEVARRAAPEDCSAVVLTSSPDRAEPERLAVGSVARRFVPKHELSSEAIEALL